MIIPINKMYRIINELNELIIDRHGIISLPPMVVLSTDGSSMWVKFHGETIWDSEMDTREYFEDINEYEPILEYLKKQIMEHIRNISVIRL